MISIPMYDFFEEKRIFATPYFRLKNRFCNFFGVAIFAPNMVTPICEENQRGGHGGHGGHPKNR